MKKCKGQCLCGAIKFTLEGEPTAPHLCYCDMCKLWSGAPVVAWVDFPLKGLRYQRGKPTLYRSSKKSQRGFCNKCGSTLFALDDNSESICMVVSVLEERNKIKPEFESFRAKCPKWLKIPKIAK